MGLLQRLGQDPQVVHVGEFAVISQPFFGPGFADDIDCLIEPFAALVDVHADAVELLALVAGADPQIEPPTTDVVNHGCFFGHQDGIVQGQHDHGGADADALGPAGDHAGEGPDAR